MRLGFIHGNIPTTNQGLGIDLAHRAHLVDDLVHLGLGVAGIVTFVVTVLAIAHNVNDDVAVEGLAKLEGQLGRARAGLGVVAVDVKDGRLDHLRNVSGIKTRTCRFGRRGKAHLIVNHHVQRAAHAITRELREVQRLSNDALAGKGRVAVNENRQVGIRLGGLSGRSAVARAQHHVLFRAHDALNDRAHCFKV